MLVLPLHLGSCELRNGLLYLRLGALNRGLIIARVESNEHLMSRHRLVLISDDLDRISGDAR